MSELRALLLTDLVDSTKLSEQLGDEAMSKLWSAHDRAARDLLPQWRGREIDKTDGLLLMFEDAADAVQYVVAYHKALSMLPVPLCARAGLHVGPVILRENSAADVALGGKPLEVDGLAKPTAARVMSLAQGGQTLLTLQAREALAHVMSAIGLGLASHGHWVLKGLSEPLELFEVGMAPLRIGAPIDGEKGYRVVAQGGRWLPVRDVPTNLPAQPNAFVGREHELDEIKALLSQTRLVNLLGMGGLGKTRLGIQAANELRAEHPDGVWFIDLAPLREGNLVLTEAAQVLGVREEPGRALVDSIGQFLKVRRTLLVVDNCEHLVKAAANLIHSIMKVAPRVAFIASSRISLRVPGEHTYPILPLPLPPASASLPELLQSTSVRLFMDRAQEQRPDFRLTEAQAPAVTELVARLEGIPLALELAAARLRTLSVSEINSRLKNRFKLLTGGSLVNDERQQTLRGLVDWSYDMLEPEEKSALQRLAVFRGGFDLPAAEAVCGDAELASDEVLDLLTSLVEKSLVTMEQRDSAGRFRMLETVREYGVEKLSESGGMQAAASRHCLYFFDLAKQGREGMQGPQQREWLERLDLEHDNLRAAMMLPQTEDSGVDPLVALKMAVALQNFWILRGLTTEGRMAVGAMMVHPAVVASPLARGHGLYVGAALASTQGDVAEALNMLSECLQIRRETGPPREVAATLSTLALTRLSIGDIECAREDATEAIRLFVQTSYRVGEAIARLQLGQVEAQAQRPDDARSHLKAALALAREVRNLETEGESELVLGEVEMECGHTVEATMHFERSLAICNGAGDRRGEANARWAQGRLALRCGDVDGALSSLIHALRDFDEFEIRGSWVGCLEDVAAAALARHDVTLACSLAAAAQRVREGTQLVRSPVAQARWLALISELRILLGANDFDYAWAAGHGWDTAELRNRALVLKRHHITS